MMSGLKIKNRLMKKTKSDLPPVPALGGDEEEVKEEKRIKNLGSKQIINQTSSTVITNKI